MLALKVNNTYLDLDPKTAVTINLENPIFDREGIERVYSYPFEIKNNARNLRALGFSNRVDSSAAVKLPAVLYLTNNPFETGILVVNGSTEKKISLTFQNKAIDLLDDFRTVKLQGIPMPVKLTDEYCPDVTLVDAAPGGGNPATHTSIRINGELYVGDKLDLPAFVNDINADYPGLAAVTTVPNPEFIAIIIFCTAYVDDLLIELKYSDAPPLTGIMNVYDVSDDAQRIIDDVTTIALTGEFNDSLRFPVAHIPKLYDDANPGYSSYANYVDRTGDLDLTPGDISNNDPLSWSTTILPMPRLYYLLEQIADYFDINIGGSLWRIDEFRNDLILWTNRPAEQLWTKLKKPIKDAVIRGKRIRIVDSTINIEQHLPDATIEEFFTRIINTFCGFLTFRDGVLRFQLIRPLLRGRPQDWTQYAEPDFTQDIQERESYSLDYERSEDEPGIDGQLLRIDGGTDSQEFLPGFYTLYDESEVDAFDEEESPRSWLTPYTSEAGISAAFDNSQETSFRLLLYRGLHSDSEENTYPLATHGRLSYTGEQVGEYQLSWEGEGGLFYWWEDYINLTVKGRTITKLLRLPVDEILALRNWDSVVKKIYSEFGEFSGVVKTVRFKATTNGISLAEVTFAKL